MTYGRRVQRTTNPTKVPGIPKPPTDVPASLQRYLSNLGEALEIRLGRKGDVRDRAITLRELIDSGMAVDLANNPYDPNNPGGDFGGNNDPEGNLAEFPIAPTGFSVTAGFANVGVFWDHPENQYRGHSYTEVYRADADTLSTATLIGSTPGNSFTDFIGEVTSQTTYYYWARHVNVNNQQGPFNANAGTAATLEPSSDFLLTLLENSIESTHLVQSLRDPISNLPADTNASFLAVESDVTDLEAQYTVKIQTNFNGNTHISGYGLANTVNNGTVESAFIIAADRFAVINPTTYTGGQTTNPTDVPFVVQSNATTLTLPSGEVVDIPAGVFIDSAFISKARILDLIAGSVTADFVLSSSLVRAPAIHGGTFNIGTFSTNGNTDPRYWTVTGSNRVSNFSVNANGVMHATAAVMEGVTIKAPDGTVLLDAGGMTGGSGGNLAYNSQFRRGVITFDEATGSHTEDTQLPDAWREYNNGNAPQSWLDSNGGTTTRFRSNLGWVRCGYDDGNKYQSYVRQTSQRFPVVSGETLYVYSQTGSLTGLWMSVAYYSSSDGGSVSNYVTQTNVTHSGNFFDSETVVGANGANRNLNIASITVPTNSGIEYGELRFGSNTGDQIFYFDVGVSRTPPVIGPKYAATYIRDLSVDTFQIAGEAVTLPEVADGIYNSSVGYTEVELTTINDRITFSWSDVRDRPSKIILLASIQVLGDTSQRVGVRGAIKDTGGNEYAAATQSHREDDGGQTVVAGMIDMSGKSSPLTLKLMCRVYLGASGTGGSRTVYDWTMVALAAKK